MKSISVQYQELKEGRMTQHQFLRNARMLFPNHVTNHNSFEDSVKILKNRGLLNEGDAVKGTPDKAPSYDYPTQPAKYKKVVQEPEVDEQDGIYPATTVTDIPKEEVSKPIKSKNRPDGLEPAKDKDKKNEMKKVRIVKESKRSLTELTSVSDKEIQSAEFNSLKNIQKDYLSNHPLSIQPTSFSGDKGSPLKLTDLRWYSNKDNTFGFTMIFERPGNRDEYIDVTFYKDKQNNPVKNIRLTDKIQDSWKEYKDDIVGYLNKAMRSAQVDGKFVDNVIVALSRMTPEKIGYNQSFTEANLPSGVVNTPDEQNFEKKLKQSALLMNALRLINMQGELDGLFSLILNATNLSDVSKTTIVTALRRALDQDGKDANFTADTAEKSAPASTNPIDKARQGLRSSGVDPNDFSKNRLKEVIKKLVNETLDEYEKGDESDEAPSSRDAISMIVNKFTEVAERDDIESPKLSDVEETFSMFENEVGKRYSDAVYNEVLDRLKEKGYNFKFK